MSLHGLTSITLGVPDVDAVASYYEDFGLRRVGDRPGRGLVLATAEGGAHDRNSRAETPFGMTGARITTTLISSLQFHDKQFGLETMCVGGGQGMALVLERLS